MNDCGGGWWFCHELYCQKIVHSICLVPKKVKLLENTIRVSESIIKSSLESLTVAYRLLRGGGEAEGIFKGSAKLVNLIVVICVLAVLGGPGDE